MEIGNEVNGGFIDFGGAGRGQGNTLTHSGQIRRIGVIRE